MSDSAPPAIPPVAADESAPRDERRAKLIIGALVFVFALAVRCVGFTWGLPNAERWYSYHPDESTRQIVGAVGNLLQGDFNPHFFNYPSLSVYATWLFYQVLATLGLTTNVAAPQYPWPVVRDIIVAGRLFSVVCGAGTAVLVWGIARQLGLCFRRGALLAAILAALAPGHVQHSHFATVDVPATFFAVLCVWLTLRATSTKALLGAAFAAGLAAGTKYNVGLVLVVPLAALWLSQIQSSSEKASTSPVQKVLLSLGCIAVAIVAFLVSTPYSLLDFPAFWGDDKGNGFYFEAFVHPKIGSDNFFVGTGNGWWYHFSFNLPFVLTWPLVVAALVGIGFAAKDRAWWPILAFVGLFFFSLGFSQVRFMRYLMPLAPLLCVFAAYAASRLPKPQIVGAVVGLFAILGTGDVLMPFVRKDPRDEALTLLIQPLIKRVGMIHAPWFYTPPFQPEGNNTLPSFPHPIQVVVTNTDTTKLKAEMPDAFVVSDFDWREDRRLNPQSSTFEFEKLLRSTYRISFPYRKHPYFLPGRDFVPHDYLYTSPLTTVYYSPLATNPQ